MAAGEAGQAVILVRRQTTPDDVLGMQASRGILTTHGGMVSHAAVVARGWGIPAVVGAAEMHIDGDRVTIDHTVLRVGDEITIDGTTGHVYAGALATSGASAPPELDHAAGVGRHCRSRPRAGASQRRHRRGRRRRASARSAGHRTVPDRAHVPRRRSVGGDATLHPQRRRRRRGRRRWPSWKVPRPPTSRGCSRRWTRCP